ncbi:hypothetical protein TcasGA2_TC005957 [Tribolium castaneum]|uniref:Uncharacterized protein n=1 Tax=Tribolium castaneum TaxID=7070 RepID=D6WVC5_TRICA|nr:PREDICTED: uncharacterized protein LOC103313866 [Tribolium castaneum]EFA08316.1 hypothetical protein TcasGA2_TC005957 [Tribolium castaneum]|eukprot:XP_008196468.1 PREDICTED: uncharacterized protein LOC103313866 [Tribolium castaneum]
MSANCDRQTAAKKLLQGKGRDTTEQRINRRQRLVQHFKSLRIETIDRFRKMSHDDLTYEILNEMKKCILSTLDTKELLDAEEMTQIMDDLHKEMIVLEIEQHEKDTSDEIDSITNSLMSKCCLCGDLVVQSNICDACVEELNS